MGDFYRYAWAMQNILWLAGAGMLGTLARYGLGLLVRRAYAGDFPLGTLIINALGCLLFGFVWSLAESRLAISPETRAIILIGFMGAFTTFSSYIFEVADLIEQQQWLLAFATFAAQNLIGLLCMFIGLFVGRQ